MKAITKTFAKKKKRCSVETKGENLTLREESENHVGVRD